MLCLLLRFSDNDSTLHTLFAFCFRVFPNALSRRRRHLRYRYRRRRSGKFKKSVPCCAEY